MVETKRIMIVEDEPDHRMAMQMIFEREEGIEVYSAADTGEADRILGDEEIDLILLDIALPGEDGLHFCRRLRSRPEYADLPIIALSAFPDQLWRDKALDAGCTEFVGKPFDPPKLLELVRATERHDRSLTPPAN
jgi:DNA-binding response OmpR family regulator